MDMTCSECPNTVHPERLAAIPNAKTCSRECTDKRQRKHKAAGALKATRKARAARKKER